MGPIRVLISKLQGLVPVPQKPPEILFPGFVLFSVIHMLGITASIYTTIKQLCMNLHFFRGLVSAMNIILGHYNLIILLELMV